MILLLAKLKHGISSPFYVNPAHVVDYTPDTAKLTVAVNYGEGPIEYQLEGVSPLRSYLDAAIIRGAGLDPFADAPAAKKLTTGTRSSPPAPTTEFKI